jgi:perosamine synthetase
MNRINQVEPWIGEEEQKAVAEYLSSGGWLTEFKKTREFERRLADFVGSRYALIVSNGTVSLSIALMALGIKGDDEVIVPNYTQIASSNSVVLAGAKPVLVDIDSSTHCLDLDLAEKAITSRTKAIMFVSLNGRCPDMNKVVALTQKYGLHMIEDAAESLGCTYKGKHLGTFGIIGSFSFSPSKIITAGQGGGLVTDDEGLYNEMSSIKDFGRYKAGVDSYRIMGFNFKYTDLQAVIGIEQMKKLQWRVKRKKEMYALYQHELAGVSEVRFVDTDLEDTAPWFIDVLVPDPLALKDYLGKRDIGTRPFFPPIHSQPPYELNGEYPNSEYVSTHGLWLPSSSFLSDKDIKRVCTEIKRFYHKKDIEN